MARVTTSLINHNGIYFTFSARDSHSPFFLRPSFNNKLPLTSLPSIPSPSGRRQTLVSTVPVEYVPPPPPPDFDSELNRLLILRSNLSNSKILRDKIRVVDSDSKVKKFFTSGYYKNGLARVLETLLLDEYELYLIKCIVAAGQEHVLRSSYDNTDSDVDSESVSSRSALKSALYSLVEMIEKWDGSNDREVHVKKVDGVALNSLLKTLKDVEEFYDCIGGIIGLVYTLFKILSLFTLIT